MKIDIDRKHITENFFVVLLFIGLIAFLYLLKPLYPALLLALILVYIFNPVVDKVEAYSKRRWIGVLFIIIFVIPPLSIFLGMLVLTFISEIRLLLRDPQVQEFLQYLGVNIESYVSSLAGEKFSFSPSDLSSLSVAEVYDSLQAYQQWFTKGFEAVSGFFRTLSSILFQTILGGFFALYALLKMNKIRKTIRAIEHEKIQMFLVFVDKGLKQVVYSMFLTSVFGGVISAIIYWYFGLPFILLLSILTGLLILIPLVGGWLVYLPLTGYILWKQGLVDAALFFVVCAIFISTMPDLLIRPMLAKSKEVDFVLLSLGFISGVIAFGAIGIILGPLLIICAVGVFKILSSDNEESKN
jgi:predicted PurR-regulated permease PerM